MLSGIEQLLKSTAFVVVATADKNGQPNAAPKLLLKIIDPYIYIIDYVIAKTVENLRENPRASVSFMDLNNLEGYRVNGTVELIEKGEEHETISKELSRRLMDLSVTRVIEGARTGTKHEHFEVEISEKFVAFKFKVEDVVKIGARGDLYRESV